MLRASMSPRIAAVWFFLVVGLTSVTGAYALHTALPRNPIRLPFQDRAEILVVLPEGWAFFTRNAREERTRSYLRDANGRWPSEERRLAEPKNLFGISRVGRARELEKGLVFTQIPAAMWTACDRSVDECLEDAPVARELTNPTPGAALCGIVGFSAQEPVPWAWWRAPQASAVRMPIRIVKARVRC
jgi:antimicrobial peptide system SdpA family protein